MEILEIQSKHSLINRPDSRPMSAHVYKVKCQSFTLAHNAWRKNDAGRGQPLAIMTLGMDRIWMTKEEVEQVVAAIQSSRSPLALD